MNILWKLLAKICALPWIATFIIRRSLGTPYQHIYSKNGRTLYMGRWWLFNPYAEDSPPRISWLPSIRIHQIRVEDQDRHMHSHPWDARTIILRGWYQERRQCSRRVITRNAGDTAGLMYGEFHRITRVCPEGCWTIFITWRKQGSWFFDVDGKHVPWRKYLGID